MGFHTKVPVSNLNLEKLHSWWRALLGGHIHTQKMRSWWRAILGGHTSHKNAVNFTILWRVLHPNIMTTSRKVLLELVSTPVPGATWLLKAETAEEDEPSTMRGKSWDDLFNYNTFEELSLSKVRTLMSAGPRPLPVLNRKAW